MIEMAIDTPKECKPGALAFALPYEGVRITVFYDRVQQMTAPVVTPTVLAHGSSTRLRMSCKGAITTRRAAS